MLIDKTVYSLQLSGLKNFGFLAAFFFNFRFDGKGARFVCLLISAKCVAFVELIGLAGCGWRFMNCVKWEVSGIYIHLFHLLVWLAFLLPISTQKGGKKIFELQTKEQQNQFKRKLAVLLSLSTESLTLSHGTFHI